MTTNSDIAEPPVAVGVPPPGPRLLASALLPGLLAGAHLAGLLFFLNPELPFRVVPLLRGVLAYAALLGTVSLVLHLPLLGRRRARAERALPWSLAFVLLLFAVLDAVQASWYAYYLPAGINVRLLKAAAWLALAALVVLCTALAHTLGRRRYGLRSRWAIALVAVLSLYALVERREAYQPRPEPTPLAAVVEGQRQLELYVVGIDTATLDALLPLAEQGRLPFLSAMLREGSYARLRSFTPTRAQPLWATLGTGKYPHRHGVRSDWLEPAPFLAPGVALRLLPAGIGFGRWGLFGARSLPAGRDERHALALWDVLARLEVTSGVIGWPEATPSAGVPLSFAVSEGFFRDQPRQVWPPALATRAARCRVGAAQIDSAVLAGFGSPPPPPVIGALAQDLWRQTLALQLLDQPPRPRAFFLRLPGLRQVSRRWFGGYAAHELEGVQSARVAASARLVEDYYRFLDDYLGQLWRHTRGPRLLAVVSPFGASTPGPWRRVASFGRTPLEGVLSGTADGVLLLRGDEVRAGSFVGDAAIEDVVPTMLYALGLPVGRDMDGRALTGAFEPSFLATHPLSFVPSYETLGR
ncbi:MAG TPA: alkaline phosphatase family protein [Thermoanaerobaculia bacterium]|jgi:hypothetical protein|nr:alkaline phosphatase family protein [Thermoanaerobaculia bacterium]